ncbi:MAG: TPM domain-containing protein [Asticcacaulis sp.]
MKLTQDDHARINAAIAAAEHTTTGEITCILRREQFDYPEVPLGWAAAVALILPLALLPFGITLDQHMDALIRLLTQGWTVAHDAANRDAMLAVEAHAALQFVLFVATYLIVSLPGVRHVLTPRILRQRRAHQKALELFRVRGLDKTRERTGVLIFCSLFDHHVEVIADEGIYKKVDKSVWRDAVTMLVAHIKKGKLADGYIAAISRCGAVLSEHFPARADNPNESPDILIEL